MKQCFGYVRVSTVKQSDGFSLSEQKAAICEYAALFELLLRPIALDFGPELILVSAGFDTHLHDPLGGMRMSAAGFAGLTRSLMQIAETCCDGRLVLALEGGYHPEALSASVLAVIDELTQRSVCDVEQMAGGADPRKLDHALSRSIHVQGQFWKRLQLRKRLRSAG